MVFIPPVEFQKLGELKPRNTETDSVAYHLITIPALVGKHFKATAKCCTEEVKDVRMSERRQDKTTVCFKSQQND